MGLFGTGSSYFVTKNQISSLAQTIMQEICYTQISLTSNKQEAKARCRDRNSGRLITKRKKTIEVEHILQLTFEHTDWKHMGFIHDELPQDVSTNFSMINFGTVPTTGAFEIADAGITAGTAAGVRVYLTEAGTWGEAEYLKNVTTAPANKGEVQIDNANSKMVFHSDLAGAPIAYLVDTSYSSISSIGVADAYESFGELELYFKSFGSDDFPEGLWYRFPTALRSEDPPQIDFNASPMVVTIQFEVVSATGRPFPYEIINPALAA